MSQARKGRALTPRTTVEQLRQDAKRWLKALRAGAPDARARFNANLMEPGHAR